MTPTSQPRVEPDFEELRAKLVADRARYTPGTPEKYPLAPSSLTILEAEALLARAEAAEERERGLRKGLEIIASGFEHAPSVAKVFLRDYALAEHHPEAGAQ